MSKARKVHKNKFSEATCIDIFDAFLEELCQICVDHDQSLKAAVKKLDEIYAANKNVPYRCFRDDIYSDYAQALINKDVNFFEALDYKSLIQGEAWGYIGPIIEASRTMPPSLKKEIARCLKNMALACAYEKADQYSGLKVEMAD